MHSAARATKMNPTIESASTVFCCSRVPVTVDRIKGCCIPPISRMCKKAKVASVAYLKGYGKNGGFQKFR